MDKALWVRVREIFDHLADKSPSHRRDYLDMVCDGEPDLRAEVEALLAAHDDLDDEPPWGKVAEDRTPETIGAYTIADVLGSGGMGTVYRATHPLHGEVALKTLPLITVAEATARRRFELEAQALTNLRHPALCRVFECFVHDDWAVIAMERVAGAELTERLRGGPLPRPQALAIAIELAEVLRLAHAQGIVHRDLKPSNVLLSDTGEVKLIDFGIAKFADVKLTATGQILGTPHYMSPEQWRGAGMDKRTDLWALGCLLYEMLSGRRAFRGDDLGAVALSVLNDTPDALPDQGVDGHALADLAPLLERLLCKDQEARSADAESVLAELRELRQP